MKGEAISGKVGRVCLIALLVPTLDRIGGAERQVIDLAVELARRGHRITLIALSGSASAHLDFLDSAGVRYVSLGMRKAWVDPRGWHRYLRWVRENRPDIIHAHLPHATWFARWVRLVAPVRVVIDTIHTSRTATPSKQVGYRLSRWLSDHTTCVSQSVATIVLDARLVSCENCSVIANGVKLTEPAPARELKCAGRQCVHAMQFVWIALGRLEPVKDHRTLLRAFARLVREPFLRIVGTGTELDALKNLARELAIERRVEFTGFQDNVQELLASADAFVLSSLWEGLPVSILEAQAAGLPVVATDGSGTREAMADRRSGFLVPTGNVPALAEKMARVMNMSPEERRVMGENGQAFVRERSDLAAIVDQWERLYERLRELHKKRSRWSS